MIVCTECGARSDAGESFCGECGAYLEWDGELVGEPEPQPAAVVAPAPPEPESPGLLQRVKDAVGIGNEAPPAEQTPAAGAVPPAAPAAPSPPSPSAPVPQVAPRPAAAAPPSAAPPSAATQPAAPPSAAPPHAATQPVPTQPAPAQPAAPTQPGPVAVRPGAAAPRPPRREQPPDERPPAPGELICGACGAGNAPTRKFCRRCGTSLADAPVAARLPWWRRLFARSPKAEPVAGTRKKQRRRRRRPRFVAPIGLLLVLVVAAVLTRSLWDPYYKQVLDKVEGTKLVQPIRETATSAASGHPAAAIADGATNRYWAPAGDGKRAVGQSVTATLPSSVRLVYVRVFGGVAEKLTTYLTQSSPAKVTVTLLRGTDKPVVKTFMLNDKPGGQDLHVATDDVKAVRIRIDSVNRPSPARVVAIGEVEFLARK